MSYAIQISQKEYTLLLEAVKGWRWYGTKQPYSFAADIRGFQHPETGLEFEVIDYTIKGIIDTGTGQLLPAECVCDCGCLDIDCYYCENCAACSALIDCGSCGYCVTCSADDDDFKCIKLEMWGPVWGSLGNYWEPAELDEVLEMIAAQEVSAVVVPEFAGELVKEALEGSDWADRFTCWGDGIDMGDDFQYCSGLLTRRGVDGFLKVSDDLSRVEFAGPWSSMLAETADLMEGDTLVSFLEWLEDTATPCPLFAEVVA
jgi:hypothetical protein